MYKNVCVVFRISYQAPNSENSSVSLHQVTSVHVHVVSDYFYHNTSLTHSIKIRNANSSQKAHWLQTGPWNRSFCPAGVHIDYNHWPHPGHILVRILVVLVQRSAALIIRCVSSKSQAQDQNPQKNRVCRRWDICFPGKFSQLQDML